MREHGDPGPRRRGLRRRPPGRALVPRRARDDALRGHLADPEAHHRASAHRHQRAGPRTRHDASASSAPGRWARASRSSAARPARRRVLFDPDASRSTRARGADRDGDREGAARGRADAAACACWARRLARDLARLRRRDRGGPRGPRAQAARVRRGRRRRRARDCVLATNTSSLPVTAVAAGVERPERVVGMHFFNPAAGHEARRGHRGRRSRRTGRSRACARSARRWAGAVIDAADGPGFLVNRCNRPVRARGPALPAASGLADVETIDRIVRMGGGFRMGPFELSDLVGIDVGFEVAQVVLGAVVRRAALAPVAAAGAASSRPAGTGARPGAGWYAYGDGPHRPDGPPAARSAGAGSGRRAHRRRRATPRSPPSCATLAAAAGWDVREPSEVDGDVPWLSVDCGRDEDEPPLEGAPQLAAVRPRARSPTLDGDGPAAGFHALPPLADARAGRADARAVHVGRRRRARRALLRARSASTSRGSATRPGLVLGRIVCQLVNEAAFALGEGVGSAAGHRHGPGPRDEPPARAARVGRPDRARARVRRARRRSREHGGTRYRVAPELRRRAGARPHVPRGRRVELT